MKICENCKRELTDEMITCPYCSQELYENAVKLSKTTNIASLILIILGIIFALFINAWVGAIICFASEMVSLIPNTKLTSLFKKVNSGITDKKKLQADTKSLSKWLKSKNKDYKRSFIISSVALVLMITFILFDFILPITKNNSSTSQNNPTTTAESVDEDYSENIITEEDVVETTEDIVTTENSAAQLQNEPIVGNWDFSYFSYETGGTAPMPTGVEYIKYMHFEPDGTGNFSWKHPTAPVAFSETTWKVAHSEIDPTYDWRITWYDIYVTDGLYEGVTFPVILCHDDTNKCFMEVIFYDTYKYVCWFERNTTVYNY